ncbi:aspartate carbamoyltransferase [Candidatus Microgenomates bacterium]|nr:aspartate carbamoyltransferase [Candidatus Microgenomates bacterium]
MALASLPKIKGNFKGKDILSLDQFDIASLQKLFKLTKQMAEIAKKSKPSKLLAGNIVTLLFYEPSSRTFGSFAAAIKQLGGQTVEILDPQHFSSVYKGETFEDTIRVFEAYCDAIVIRHPQVGSAQAAADIASFAPIINAGDGPHEHPTQALLDLYTIYERFKKLDHLIGVVAGDMLYGRTVKSLIRGLALYKANTVYLLSPDKLRLSKEDFANFQKRHIKLIQIESEQDIPKNAHFWYWTRVQKERFTNLKDYEKVKNKFVLTPKLIKERAGAQTIFMHPLPRVGEISPKVDSNPRAVYLRSQIRNGMYIRMALLALILGKIRQ